MDPDTRVDFLRDFRAAQEATLRGVVDSRSRAADSHWRIWTLFCRDLALDPLLAGIDDPIMLLQVFATRYRDGRLAPRGKPVRARTVEDAVRSIGQTLALLGAGDPRYTNDRMDFRLTRLRRSYGKKDPPPGRVKPVPLAVIRQIALIAQASDDPGNHAVADMIIIAFFFLLRPGEYTAGPNTETTPFCLRDVQLSQYGRRLNLHTEPTASLANATFATLTFTTQKNGVRGEVIGLGLSGSPQLCPVKSIVRRVLHIRQHAAPPDTPLATYCHHNTLIPVRPADLTATLRQTVAVLGPSNLGFLPSDVSARSLRAAGAMALLVAHVDTDTIRLIGRWRSDEMLRYLHVQAEPVMRNFSRNMLEQGDFTLLPNPQVPP